MKLTIAVAMLAAALFGLSCDSGAGEIAPTQVRSEDEEAIKSIALERIERFNKHEAPRSASFTPDADFVNVYGMWRRGPAEIESRQKERMETVLKEAKITLLDLRIRFLRPDVAIVHELHEMSGMLNDNGEKMPPHQELGIRVLVKEQANGSSRRFTTRSCVPWSLQRVQSNAAQSNRAVHERTKPCSWRRDSMFLK